jgi:membrane dipeptidase
MKRPFIFDAHLDLAMNALEWNRDLTQPLDEIRRREAHLKDKPDRGRGTVSVPEMRRGRIGLCVATQIARLEHEAYSPVFGWRSPAQAWAMTQGQRAWYAALEEAGELVVIQERSGLEAHLKLWENASEEAEQRLPVGCILSLEGADSLVTVGHLERAYAGGLRAIGPAHYGPGVYARGTNTEGPFPPLGIELLQEAGRLGLILDVTHLSDECFWQAIDLYSGPVWASHHNARALVPHQRQMSDEMFRALVGRGGVLGVALDAWMLVPGWERGKTTPHSADLHLEALVNHIDHFCQIAGNAEQVGLGSDLDGAFGYEQTPIEINAISNLQQLAPFLQKRGYQEAETAGILSGNFLRFLRQAWPE